MNTNEASEEENEREGGRERAMETERERVSKGEGEGGRERAKRQTREERQPEPRRQSDGSFVTVMASTPDLQPPRGLHPFSFTGEHAETQTLTEPRVCVCVCTHGASHQICAQIRT